MDFDFNEVLQHHIVNHMLAGVGLVGLSKHLLMMLIAAALLAVVLPLAVRAKSGFGLLLRHAIESIVVFIRNDIVVASMGEEGLPFLSYFCTLFFFILLCNLLGLVPYGATATGNISVTGALAVASFVLIQVAGIREHGLGGYLKGMVPHGVPLFLAPILFVIEWLGYITKTFALCIRLFANMIAGHIVILSLFALIFLFGAMSKALGLLVVAPGSVAMVLFVLLLEIFVAFLQAYIFTFLTAIFVGGAIHQH